MPKRTQTYIKAPWSGGVNTSVDPGFLNDDDLVLAENVVFSITGSRLKREGFSYIDSDIPAPDTIEATGTTRTIKWIDNEIQESGPNNILVVGERITVTGDSDFNSSGVTISSITTTAQYQAITYELATSISSAEASTSTLSVAKGAKVLNLLDYWYTDSSNAQAQEFLAMDSFGKLFSYDTNNNRVEVEASSTATQPTNELDQVTSLVFNNRAIFAYSELGAKPIKYNPDDSSEFELLGGTPPDFSTMTIFLARLWTNDKTDPHRVHYSATGNHEEWNGSGDSGAIDIDPGDGDPEGIIALFPFNRELYVVKKNALFVIQGDSPENFTVRTVSRGVGAETPYFAPVGESDIFYVSKRGVQTLVSAAQGKNEAQQFVSDKIQPTFNEFEQSRLKFTQCAHFPEINSVGFTFANNSSTENEIWLFNYKFGAWYTWPDTSCTALSGRLSGNIVKPVWGTNNGRIIQAQNGGFTDFEDDAIIYRVKTGAIYPDNDPNAHKAFKKLGFLYRAKGDFIFTVKVKIDNFPVQAYTFEQVDSTELLGSTFTLGTSPLGISSVLAPYTVSIDGIGRGITIEIEQTGTDEQVELYGFIIEWEPAGLKQEVV